MAQGSRVTSGSGPQEQGAYTVSFTNVSGTWSPGGSTIDEDGFYTDSGKTAARSRVRTSRSASSI